MSGPMDAQERDRFASWLEADADTDDMLAEQMERARVPFADERRKDAIAKRRVARQLRQTQSENIGGAA